MDGYLSRYLRSKAFGSSESGTRALRRLEQLLQHGDAVQARVFIARTGLLSEKVFAQVHMPSLEELSRAPAALEYYAATEALAELDQQVTMCPASSTSEAGDGSAMVLACLFGHVDLAVRRLENPSSDQRGQRRPLAVDTAALQTVW